MHDEGDGDQIVVEQDNDGGMVMKQDTKQDDEGDGNLVAVEQGDDGGVVMKQDQNDDDNNGGIVTDQDDGDDGKTVEKDNLCKKGLKALEKKAEVDAESQYYYHFNNNPSTLKSPCSCHVIQEMTSLSLINNTCDYL